MPEDKNSRWPGFYKLSLEERIARIHRNTGLRPETREQLGQDVGLALGTADRMVENCIGVFGMPLGLGLNLRVDGVDRVVPMAIEEPSVVAGLGRAARLLRGGMGVTSRRDEPVMIGQIQILDVEDPEGARDRILAARPALLEQANALDPVLCRVGGGARDLEVRLLPPEDPQDPADPENPPDPLGTMLVVHLLVDVRDAMGANVVNTMAERLAPRVAELTGGRALLRILSNLADRRLVTVTGRVALDRLVLGDGSTSGLQIAKGVEEASVFAERDPYRAATHNKGIMNGVDAVLLAFGQDWRAVEAGAHAYASR
ncbi:MAG: 3-hydroxy-3-methylglutaryl-CoA reductase, partial [Polyangia bacterium]|nr:3-hydroxy-3-methylglutaryl-CoA reductase [Polyangia bacterium]